MLFYSGKKKHKKHADKQHEENNQDNQQTWKDVLMNDTASLDDLQLNHLRTAMKAFSLQQKPAKTPEEALTKSYQFWNTQPVPKMGKLLRYAELASR